MEKISRELSEAEEANMKNRKRLRGIALAIQSVISLLYLVRSRNNTNINNTASSSATASSPNITDERGVNKSSPIISRIPRPTSAMASGGITDGCVRRSIRRRVVTSAGATRVPVYNEPEYSLKKGFLKREEKVDTGTLKKKRSNSRTKTTPIPSTSNRTSKVQPSPQSLIVTSFKDKAVRFRPASVIDLRPDVESRSVERPGSAHGYRNKPTAESQKDTTPTKDPVGQKEEDSVSKELKTENSADNIVGESSGIASNGVKLRKKTPRSRPNSMLELSSSSDNMFNSVSTDNTPNTNNKKANNETPSKRDRPVSLFVNKNTKPGSALTNTRKAMTPSTEEYNRKRLKFRLNDQLESLNDTIKKDSARRLSPKRNSRFRLQNLSSPRCRSPTRNSQKSRKENVPEQKERSSRTATSLTPSSSVRGRSTSTTRTRIAQNDTESPSRSTSVTPPSPKKSPHRNRSSSAVSRSTYGRKSATPPKTTTPTTSSPCTARKTRNTTPTKGKWNSASSIQTKTPDVQRKPLSPKKSVNTKHTTTNTKQPLKKSVSSPKHAPRKGSDAGKVCITTEVNKRKNITFPDGKTVDKETKTKTTVSMDMNDKSASDSKDTSNKHASLLAKVKTLAKEIGNMSNIETTCVSESSSESIGRRNSDTIESGIKEEMDRFSETEYLSLLEKS